MHLPVAVRRHPRPGDHPDRPEPRDLTQPQAGRTAALAVRNVTRDTIVAARVEVAGGLWAKFLGLMGRPGLAPGTGLWLPDSNGIHMMFMRFPIDAVFVGGEAEDASAGSVRRVLSVHGALPAWRGLVPLVRGARGVLELPAGTIEAAAIAVGDLLAFTPAGDRLAFTPAGEPKARGDLNAGSPVVSCRAR